MFAFLSIFQRSSQWYSQQCITFGKSNYLLREIANQPLRHLVQNCEKDAVPTIQQGCFLLLIPLLPLPLLNALYQAEFYWRMIFSNHSKYIHSTTGKNLASTWFREAYRDERKDLTLFTGSPWGCKNKGEKNKEMCLSVKGKIKAIKWRHDHRITD